MVLLELMAKIRILSTNGSQEEVLVVQNVRIHAVSFSSKQIPAIAMKKKLEIPKDARTKVSVGKDEFEL